MCGRYASTRSAADLSALFDAVDQIDDLAPRYNVAPTDPVPVVRRAGSTGERVLAVGRWGLLPHWAPGPKVGARMINARVETVATTRAYAESFATRRALVPADGWYEWRRLPGGGKQAYFMTPVDGSVLALAGLWSRWGNWVGGGGREGHRGPDRLLTFTVLTTAALGALTEVHDRMPLVLPRDRWQPWLTGDDSGLAPPEPAVLAGLELRPVGPAVGNVRNDGPELMTRVDPPRQVDDAAPTLF